MINKGLLHICRSSSVKPCSVIIAQWHFQLTTRIDLLNFDTSNSNSRNTPYRKKKKKQKKTYYFYNKFLLVFLKKEKKVRRLISMYVSVWRWNSTLMLISIPMFRSYTILGSQKHLIHRGHKVFLWLTN